MSLFKLIQKIIKRKNKPIVTPIEQLKNNRNLIIGTGCNISKMKIEYDSINLKYNFTNIEVGKNSVIMGNIVLYNPNAIIKIGDNVFIGPNTSLVCYENITVESNLMISWGCTIIDTNAHSLHSAERIHDVLDWSNQNKDWSNVVSKPILIKNNSWIGFNSIINKGTTIGIGSIIASGSVVTKSIPDFSVYGGNPAKFIKKTD